MQSNLRDTNSLVFTIETNIKNVMNTLEITTSRDIQNAQVRYRDEYGYEKISEILNVERVEEKLLLSFDYFYTDKFDLIIHDNITQEDIQNIKITQLNQNEFYEDKDIDVRLDKTVMTAISHCGQYSSDAPSRAIDGDESTTFHSATYTNYEPGTHGDFVLELGGTYLLDRLQFRTRSSGNGRIKAYQILYKTSKTEEWKKVFEQLTEESGVEREAVFKPILASEICIRVTNGHNNFMVIAELDAFKYNFLEKRIGNLFTDETETSIRVGVTLEEIENLESEVVTVSYKERVAKAKELYILGLPQNYFSIPLAGDQIFDKVQFTTLERVFKIDLRYIDSYGTEIVIESEYEQLGTLYTLNLKKLMTSNASLVVYGVSKVENISTNSYNKSEFYIDEDVDLRIPYEKIAGSTTHPNNSYPISNMFDGNWNSQFHCSQYTGYCDVYFKLDKEYLIDRLRLVSFRSNTSGLINKFKVLLKEMNKENDWVELGEYTVGSYANEWLEVKNETPYLTDEVCLRIEDSVNGWALVSELELFIHSNLEKAIDNLFTDKSFESLREGVTYEEISALEAKNLVTSEFIERVGKARELYIQSLPQNYYAIPLEKERVFDKIQFLTTERVLRAHLKYIDTYGIERLIETDFKSLGNIYTIEINKIMTSNASLILYGVSDAGNISVNNYAISDFYINEDVDLRISYEKITGSTTHPNNSYPISNMFDGNWNSQFHCSQYTGYCDVYFKLDKEYLIDRLRLVSFRSNTSGLINKFRVLAKEMNIENTWVDLGEYTVGSYANEWLEVKNEKPYLTDEVCLRIEDSVNGWALVSELELFIHSNLEKEIKELFSDKDCEILKDGVTYDEILSLESKVQTTEEFIVLISRAKDLYLEKKPDLNFILETDRKNVMNQIKVTTSGKIYRSEVTYIDEHGFEIKLDALEIEDRGPETILTFDLFYCDRFNLMLDGDITEDLIEGIKITQLNQNNFYEHKDVDVRLNKAEMTAISHCGQYSDNAPSNAIDGNNDTSFHSSTYSGNYGDFVVELGKEYVVDRVKFITRADNNGNGNGRIRAYEILYKAQKDSEWKKAFEQLTEESGNDREAVFKPVLASEICIRVTNGKNKFVVINELDIFKYNYIEERIVNLFTDESETVLKDITTLEDIETLQSELITESYIARVSKAKELYILRLPQNYFEIKIDEQKIFDRVQFTSSERVLRAHIKYIDVFGNEKLVESSLESLGEICTVSFRKIMTKEASLIVYGVSNIENIFTNNYDIADFYIDEDIDLRIASDKIELSATNVHASYPLSNLLDGNKDSQYRASNYEEYEEVYLKLDKEYLIDRFRLISFRSPISGLVKTFKLFAKEMNRSEWIELGENSVETHENVWREVKGQPYLTDEICVRVVDSEDKWTIINEMELFIHSNLEKQIDDLFEGDSFEALKSDVTYQEILALEERVLVTQEYKEKVELAKKLYLDKKNPIHYTLTVDEESVMNQLKIKTTANIYDAEVSYLDSYGNNKIAKKIAIDKRDRETVISFEYFYCNSFNLMVRGDIVESEIEGISIVQVDQKEFYETLDVDVRLSKDSLNAISNCGQYSDKTPAFMIDGRTDTNFHSADYRNYAPGNYGEFIIELDEVKLVDRLIMTTNSSGNGRIKAYEVLYRSNKAEDWKKVFEQLTEESGTTREASFKPVLASDICVRVTNGHNHFVVVYELDLFKYNTIEARISNLFLDEAETILKPKVTLEDIESLERELKTTSYRERVGKAKQLYVDRLSAKEFEVVLSEETILNRVKFKTADRISKARLKYIDNYSSEKIIDVSCTSVGEEYILAFEAIVAKNLKIMLYGVEEIDSISLNTLNKLDFCIDEDIDLRMPVEKIEGSTTHPNNSYPISNMFDGNMNSQFHCTQYGEYCDVYFKLDKDYLIDRLRLKSFRDNESGFIKKFRVLLKDTNIENSWTELGEYIVETHGDKWLTVEGKPYLTNEVCVRIEDSINGWALINELELFIHSNLEASINSLFLDESLEALRLDVTYDEILKLEEKATFTVEFKEKVKKAKELFLEKTTKKNYRLNYNFDIVFDEINIGYKSFPEGKVDYKLQYESSLGYKIEIDSFEIIEKDGNIVSLKFERVLAKKIELTISYIDGTESWKSSYIKVVDIEQSSYYAEDDVNLEYDISKVSAVSHCGIYNSGNDVEKMLDGDPTTYFHSKTTGKVEFIFEEPKVINEFWADISHPNEANGKINKAKLYYKERDEQDWILVQDYEKSNPVIGINNFVFPGILAKRFCIDVEACYAGVIIFNRIGFNIYSSLEEKVDNLFEDKELFRVLKKTVTLEKVENLKQLVKESKSLKVKLDIATMILKNGGELPVKIQSYKAIENESSYYFGATVSNNTGDMVLSNHYIHPNTDYVFVVNREVQIALMTYVGKPSSNKTITLKKGINILNIAEQGQMIFRGSRKEKIEYYSLNKENSLIYRYGYTKSQDLFDRVDIKNEVAEDHNSNLAYVEGKTYIGAISFDWLKANFESRNLSKHIEIFDEYLDFIHYLDNVTGHFKQQMPYKRLLWCGRGQDTFHAGGSFAGGYTAYNGSSGPMIPRSTYDLANSWAVGHELGHELDSNDYLMGLFGEVTNNWFAEQPRLEYMKTLRCKGHISVISEEPMSVHDMSVWHRLGFFFKMRLFYADNSFFQKMNALMQANRAADKQEAADNFAKFCTQILKRDVSSYYLKYGFELTEEAIAWCNQYPAPAIDLQYITWENYEEFNKEEIKLFNQKYKSVSKIK